MGIGYLPKFLECCKNPVYGSFAATCELGDVFYTSILVIIPDNDTFAKVTADMGSHDGRERSVTGVTDCHCLWRINGTKHNGKIPEVSSIMQHTVLLVKFQPVRKLSVGVAPK